MTCAIPDVHEVSLVEQVTGRFGLPQAEVIVLNEPSGNRLYEVRTSGRRFVLKMTCTSGTYHRSLIPDHVRYEAALVVALRERAIPTPALHKSLQGLTASIDGHEAILFEYFDGCVCETLDYPIDQAAAALARIHQVQLEAPLDLPVQFTYEGLCKIWLPYFGRSRQSKDLPPELADACTLFTVSAAHFANPDIRSALLGRSPHVHCHGDVKPRNLIQHTDGSVAWFDFDNALYAPRIVDVIDGGVTFALAEQHIRYADFNRCDAFLNAYRQHGALTVSESADLDDWLQLGCLLHFTRELTTWVYTKDEIRRKRALAIANYVKKLPTPAWDR